MDSRIRIRTKLSWIRNTGTDVYSYVVLMQVDYLGAAAAAAPGLGNATGPQARLQCTYIYFIRGWIRISWRGGSAVVFMKATMVTH
jgi:hypothetical protein